MTTTTRPAPAPAHGTEARYKGTRTRPGCRCRTCLDGWRKAHNLRALAHMRGTPPKVPSGPVADHVDALLATGMSRAQIAHAAGVDTTTISDLVRRAWPTCRRANAERILAVKPGQVIFGGTIIDATGTRRRLRALQAMGYTLRHLAAELHSSEEHVRLTVNGQLTVRKSMADKAAAAYRRLATKPGPSDIARRRAHSLGWPPPSAWDDNIDNPAAHPDWTGHCGTHRGWHLHRIHQLPMCDRCQAAHEAWLDEHQHLDKWQRGRLIGTERQAVADRGRTLAEDARELLGQGYSREQAAHRLGITCDHLGTILRRYPETAQEQEGAAA